MRSRSEKGSDRRQPRVSTSRAVTARAFEVVEKREHAVGVDALHAKIVGLEASLPLEESQEQLERVPVCRDCAIAEPPLIDQVVAEVALQDRAKQFSSSGGGGFHGDRPGRVKRSNLAPAAPRSSRVPVRYQYVSLTLPWPR